MPRETVSKSERLGDGGGGSKNYGISHRKTRRNSKEYENEDISAELTMVFLDQS